MRRRRTRRYNKNTNDELWFFTDHRQSQTTEHLFFGNLSLSLSLLFSSSSFLSTTTFTMEMTMETTMETTTTTTRTKMLPLFADLSVRKIFFLFFARYLFLLLMDLYDTHSMYYYRLYLVQYFQSVVWVLVLFVLGCVPTWSLINRAERRWRELRGNGDYYHQRTHSVRNF